MTSFFFSNTRCNFWMSFFDWFLKNIIYEGLVTFTFKDSCTQSGKNTYSMVLKRLRRGDFLFCQACKIIMYKVHWWTIFYHTQKTVLNHNIHCKKFPFFKKFDCHDVIQLYDVMAIKFLKRWTSHIFSDEFRNKGLSCRCIKRFGLTEIRK